MQCYFSLADVCVDTNIMYVFDSVPTSYTFLCEHPHYQKYSLSPLFYSVEEIAAAGISLVQYYCLL